jgi:amino acid transporter, AAT family
MKSATTDSLLGAVDLVGAFLVTWGLWYVVLHPNGVMKLFTPMYGFSLVVVLATVVVTMTRFAEGWPRLAGISSRPVRGLVRSALAVVLTLLIVHGFFWGFLGRYGVTYFSPQAIVAAGGVGAEFFNARENASTAIVYLATTYLWVGLVLTLGLGTWPWSSATPGLRGFSRLTLAGLLAVLGYAILFHPHVTQLFYPAQIMAGVPPWWQEMARTGSAYFNLGWVMATIAVLVVSDVLWGGWPWRALGAEGGWWRGVVALLGSLALGAALFLALEMGMTVVWGEAFQGGQYTDAPSFRHLHVAEIAGFLVLATYALDTYFPGGTGLLRRGGRTLLAAAGAALLYVYYYSALGTRMLGKVQGVAQPEDTPLVWTLLFLTVVLVQRDLFERWPLAERRSA